MHRQGTIVLVPFPFTDLSGDKIRPALVLSRTPSGNDILVCFVSSIVPKKKHPHDVIVNCNSASFSKTGLKVASVIKVNKLATLDKKVVLGELGVLDASSLSAVKKSLREYLNI